MINAPKIVDLNCYRGQTWSQPLRIRDAVTKQPIDLTGITAAMEIRPAQNSPALTETVDCVIIAVEGKITLNLSATKTSGILPGVYYYDLKCTDSVAEVRYWLAGKFIVSGRVTK